MGVVEEATSGFMGGITGGGGQLIGMGFNLIIFALIIGGALFALKRMRYWAEAWIFETSGSGTFEVKKDFIVRTKDKKSGEVTYKLQRAKVEIPEPQLSERYRSGRKYVCPLIRCNDGWTRPLKVVTEFMDEEGQIQPYLQPINNQLKKHLFHVMLTKTARYRVQSALERLAPYGVMGLCAVIVIVSIHLHNKGIGG
tara:strand:+ start:2009 stop:2599 length:591 start_codon:yes stop_codon:yes gene_type:complete